MNNRDGDFVWCLHCERVFVFRGGMDECPFCSAMPWDFSTVPGCGGWGRNWWEDNGYPEVPVAGGYYPMYPSRG